MMVQIWKPNGNQFQTQLDIQIERLRFHLRALNDSLSNLYDGLALLEQEIIEVSNQVAFLKKSAKIISIKEYGKMKMLLAGLNLDRAAYLSHIKETKQGIEQTDKSIEKLYVKRKSFETKILEFRRK